MHIFPCFLLDSSICKEAKDVGNNNYCRVAILKEFHLVGKFLYEEINVQRRHVIVYKSVLYILCDALRLEKIRHDEDVTFPQLRRSVIQWWYLHIYLNLVKKKPRQGMETF